MATAPEVEHHPAGRTSRTLERRHMWWERNGIPGKSLPVRSFSCFPKTLVTCSLSECLLILKFGLKNFYRLRHRFKLDHCQARLVGSATYSRANKEVCSNWILGAADESPIGIIRGREGNIRIYIKMYWPS